MYFCHLIPKLHKNKRLLYQWVFEALCLLKTDNPDGLHPYYPIINC